MFTDLTSIGESQLAFLIPTLVSGPTQIGFSQWYNRYENDGPRRQLWKTTLKTTVKSDFENNFEKRV